MTDTISSGDPFRPGPSLRRRRGAASGARTTALTTALALVLAGGVATAAYRGTSGTSDPTTLVPSSAFAVGAVDLGLPGGQDDALRHFADHFPGSPTLHGDGSTVDRLLRPLFRGSSPSVDYDRDIRPWLGDHVAAAGWFDRDGKPQLEVLLETTDTSSARTHIARLTAHQDLGVVYTDGYAVMARTPSLAHEVVEDAHKRSLADAGTFAEDVGRLPAQEAAVGWLDGPGVQRAIRSALGSMTPDLLNGTGMFGLPLDRSGLDGRAVAGVHVTDDTAQVDVLQLGGASGKLADSRLLTHLPAGTVAALQLGDPGAAVTGVTRILQQFGALDPFAGASSGECGSALALPGATAVPRGVPHRRAILRQLRKARRQARAQQNATPGFNDCAVGPQPTPQSPLDAFTAATGLTLPGDLQTLLGDDAVVAYGGLRVGSLPDIAVRSHPSDLTAARDVAGKLQSRLAESGVAQIDVRASGSDLVMATSADYAAQVARDGDLGDQPLARAALGTVPAQVGSAGYVDLTRIWPIFSSHVPAGVTHLHAIGFWSSRDGSTQRFQLRLVVG